MDKYKEITNEWNYDGSCTLISLLFRTQKNFRTGLANLWHVAFTAFYFFCLTNYSIYVSIHMSDCVETVHELPLLPKNAASETYLHKLGEV